MKVYIIIGHNRKLNSYWPALIFTDDKKAMQFLTQYRDNILHARDISDIIRYHPDEYINQYILVDTCIGDLGYYLTERELITDKFTEFALGGITCTSTH